jgi:16S rRNA (uracil1498-N3)-methyltransferase
MSERFYVNLPLAPGAFALDGAEAHHLAVVCRIRPGAEVRLFNGDGREYPARVTHVGRRAVALEIFGALAPERELPFALEVAAALPKSDRCQFLIEKLTELGVSNYVPLSCARSNLHPREYKPDKLRRYVIEASKQCGRNLLMRIEEMTMWESYCIGGSSEETGVIAHPDQAIDWPALAKMARKPPKRIAIGPEGGFTDEELMLARQHGWQAVSLGPRILRVETAAISLAVLVIGLAKN